jgi:hypothetical protein
LASHSVSGAAPRNKKLDNSNQSLSTKLGMQEDHISAIYRELNYLPYYCAQAEVAKIHTGMNQ